MKFYRVLDMVLRKYDNKQEEYKVGSFGTSGGVLTDLNECAKIVQKYKENFLRFHRRTGIILKDEILEFQGKELEERNNNETTVHCIKVVEIDVNINN